MSRNKKIVREDDGTPVETDEDDVAPVVEKIERPQKRKVVWEQKGEDAGAWSEHGQHKTGEIVETDHADVLVSRGYATEAE